MCMPLSYFLKSCVQRSTTYQEVSEEKENDRETGSWLHSLENSWRDAKWENQQALEKEHAWIMPYDLLKNVGYNRVIKII